MRFVFVPAVFIQKYKFCSNLLTCASEKGSEIDSNPLFVCSSLFPHSRCPALAPHLSSATFFVWI